MAYTTIKNVLSLEFRDIRENTRQRRVELGGLVVVTDDDATFHDAASKSAVRKYVQNNYQMDDGVTPDADSEVRDTLRLYFLMDDDTEYHYDIPDPHDELFLSATGPGANVLRDYEDLAQDVSPTPGWGVTNIIDNILAGEYLISDGEQPASFLSGERVTWR